MSNSNSISTSFPSSFQSSSSSGKKEKVKPQTRLDLSVNPADGTLLTAPLSLVINTATDELYNDLHAMTNELITLHLPSTTTTSTTTTTATATATTTAANNSATDPSSSTTNATANGVGGGIVDDIDINNTTSSSTSILRPSQYLFTTKQKSMSNMSFQQRRHVLASTLAKHIQSISQISALVASNLITSGSQSITPSSTSTSTSISTYNPARPAATAMSSARTEKSYEKENFSPGVREAVKNMAQPIIYYYYLYSLLVQFLFPSILLHIAYIPTCWSANMLLASAQYEETQWGTTW